jgi:diadenosine tetraphosphate (Ap4A) HIT family hydrolase
MPIRIRCRDKPLDGPSCDFCSTKREVLMNSLPDHTPCRRGIYEDHFCFAILAPEQYTTGHTLLILKKHWADMTDEVSGKHLSAFIRAIHKVSKRLKESAENDRNERPERIYVCILCDGVKHLHAHLLPRYPFTEDDRIIYKERFSRKDDRGNEKHVNAKIKSGELGGFWYIAEREVSWEKSEFGQRTSVEKASFLEGLASKLRLV